MKLEHIHALVDAQPVIDIFHESTDDGSQEPDDGGKPYTHITSGRRDTDETSNGAFASADNTETALVLDVIDKDLSVSVTPLT